MSNKGVFNPSAFPASICPLGIDCSPPRTFSAMYAPLNNISPTILLINLSKRKSAGKNKGNITWAKNKIPINGNPLTISI